MLRTSRMGLVLAGALLFPACGNSGGSPTANPTPTPTPTQETILLVGVNGPVSAVSGGSIDFMIPSAGTVEATVDWTFAASDVIVAMTTTACNDAEAAFLGQCSQIGAPNISKSKPKRVSGNVTQATAARLWLFNFANVDESLAVQVTLTRTRASSEPM